MRKQPSTVSEFVAWRRNRAMELEALGWKHRLIAEALAVSESAVSRWLRARRNSLGMPNTSRHRGRSTKLTTAQLQLIPDFLWHGAEAYGFRGDVWTSARVANVIEREFGVR